jgi:peroxiredoxin
MKTYALVAIALLTAVTTAATAEANVKVGDHFVELDATAANGKHFHLKDMAGRWVLYTFGASWCGPCKKELAAWDKLAPKFAGKVVFVSVNINNKIEDGKKFFADLALKHVFPVFMPDEDSAAMKSYDPDHMPSTFVIDPKGIVRYVHFSYDKGDEDKLSAALTDLTK